MTRRVRIAVRGAVQGVGFRPFVYKLATGMGLRGWVLNSAQGVFVEVEGEPAGLAEFLLRIESEKPSRAFIQSLESSWLDPVGYGAFEIRASESGGETRALVLPDVATCDECVREIFDPHDRRHLYPFTNCTHCGPRFTIVEALPYDRANTTMKAFRMCARCRAEYEDPADRRFHAQPNACPECGPRLELLDAAGSGLATRHEALLAAAAALQSRRIVAVKGLGGFHLVVDARDEDAVQRLRARKHREEKPLAVMFPSLVAVEAACEVGRLEARLLASPEAPIVLLRRRERATVARSVAPRNPHLGVLLPYTPLHHLLLRELGFPVVATSGNLSEEPICTDNRAALERLRGIADLFLVHDRPIVRHVDDSVARVLLGREQVLRRARGWAPLPVHLRRPVPALLAVGAHLKNTIALAVADDVFVSQHIGDLENRAAVDAFRAAIASFRDLYRATPEQVVADLHPDYVSTREARELGPPVAGVQHHHAHVEACMAENEIEPPVLGVAWDGTGYGPDGTIWGGEFLRVGTGGFERVASLRTFRLPGGERAVREPRRAALGVLHAVLGDALAGRDDLPPLGAFAPAERRVLLRMLERGVNAPVTSSAGRLFDAVAALVGLRQESRFEGQAAMELEFAIPAGAYAGAGASAGSRPARDPRTPAPDVMPYPFEIVPGRAAGGPGRSHGGLPAGAATPGDADPAVAPRLVVDWGPMIRGILADLDGATPVAKIALRFHLTLAETIVEIARRAGEERVALTGGCFQNRFLTERAVQRLESEGFRPYWHQRVPPNDGGIALGQIAAAARALQRKECHVPGGAR